MFLCWTQTDDTNGFFIGTLGERQHAKAGIYQPDGHEPYFSVVKPIVFTLKRRVPVKIRRSIERHAVFYPVNVIFGRIELNSHLFYVHPFNLKVKCERVSSRGQHAIPDERQ